MKKLNYGVIGCGVFGEYQIMGVINLDSANLVAVCDKDEKRMMEIAQKYNVKKTYTDYNELLKDDEIDAVIIVTPDQAHAKITIAALNRGKHVLCEKPMSLDLDECKAMIKASDETGKKLMVGQICRMTPGFIEAKRLVDEGVIGDLYYVESEYAHDYSKIPGADGWRTTPERHPIIGGACHAIDLLRWIAGNPTETFAYSNHKVLTDWPVDDCTISVFKFPNDVIGKVFCSIGCKRNYTMRTLLYGTKGTITVNNKDPYIVINRERLCDEGNVLGGTWGEEEHELILKKPINLDDHNTKGDDGCFAIVSIDILSLPKTTGGSFRRRVLGKVNKFTDSFNFDNIIVTATHSHTSGPCNGENELDYEYIESLVDTVAMCIVNAQKQLEDADAFFALGKAEGLAFIRNYIMKDGKIKTNPLGEKNDIVKPYGKTDTSVPMLFIKDKKGNLKGALVGFACHHDCVHGTLSSADYSGILANELKSKYGENFVTVFLNGFCANVNNWDLINIDDIPPVEDYIRIGKGNIISDPSSIAYKRQTAKELLEIYRDGPTSFEATISVAKIGDCFIVATPGEMFNQYGDMLREKMPTKKVFIAELSNNELIEAYIPVKELLNVESVYETAPNSRRLEDDAGIMMIDKAAEIANTLI